MPNLEDTKRAIEMLKGLKLPTFSISNALEGVLGKGQRVGEYFGLAGGSSVKTPHDLVLYRRHQFQQAAGNKAANSIINYKHANIVFGTPNVRTPLKSESSWAFLKVATYNNSDFIWLKAALRGEMPSVSLEEIRFHGRMILNQVINSFLRASLEMILSQKRQNDDDEVSNDEWKEFETLTRENLKLLRNARKLLSNVQQQRKTQKRLAKNNKASGPTEKQILDAQVEINAGLWDD